MWKIPAQLRRLGVVMRGRSNGKSCAVWDLTVNRSVPVTFVN